VADAVFAQSDRVDIHAGTIGMVGLVAYTGVGPIPNLLRRLTQASSTGATRPQDVEALPPLPRARVASASSRPERRQ
jgi:hypothetical protein